MLNSDAEQTQDQPTSSTAAGEEIRVLIVDDNPSFTELLASALNSVDGIACIGTASSALEGLARVVELRPSVVVMDIMMPGVDGLAATTRVRQISPDTAIVVASAHTQNEWIARAEDAGASAYIPKGGSLVDMIEVLSAARPGPMIVAPSLRAAWSSWKRLEPEQATAPNNSPSPAGRSSFRLGPKTRRAIRGVARGVTAASEVRAKGSLTRARAAR
jgi:DNA-binding NarL/FixJ family response regulator